VFVNKSYQSFYSFFSRMQPLSSFSLRNRLVLGLACCTVAFALFATLWGLHNSFSADSRSQRLQLQVLDVTKDPSRNLIDRLADLRAAPELNASRNFFFPQKSLIFRIYSREFSRDGTLDVRFLRAEGVRLSAVLTTGEFLSLSATATPSGFQVKNAFPEFGENLTGEVVGEFVTREFSRPQFRWFSSDDAANGLSRLDRTGSLLIGAVLAIAVFSLILGWLCGDSVFYIFSIWSVLSLRTAIFNGGWDSTWLGLDLSQSQNDFLLRLSLSAYPLVTFLLFGKLFQNYFTRRIRIGFIAIVFLSSVLFLSTIFQTYETSYGNVRYVSLVGILFCFFAMFSISKTAPSRILHLYAAGWTAFFLGILADIGTATGTIPIAFQSFLNSQVSVVVSVLMIACSLAERMNVDRRDRVAAEQREKTALQKFRSTYDGAPIGLCYIDSLGSIVSANPHCLAIFSVSGFSKLPIAVHEIFGEANFAEILRTQSVEGDMEVEPLELAIQRNDGLPRWLAVRMIKATGGYECTIADVSARKGAEERADWLVDHDSATSLLNRRGFYIRLEQSVSKLDSRQMAYLLAVKIENFRQYTTYFGELFASELAKTVAKRISQSGVSFEGLGRTGENIFFAVLVADCRSEIQEKIDLLSAALNNAVFSVDNRELVVALAFAAVELDQSKELKISVAACEIAVGKPANKQVSGEKIYNKTDVKLIKIMEELDLISQFRFEFPASQLFLVAQPIISAKAANGSMCYEVLVRMRASDGGVIAPDRFIPAVEKSGLMSRLDEWVISNAFEWLVGNPEHLAQLTYVSINLSGASLNDVKFLNTILALAAKYPDAVRKTCFEITEGVALANFESTVRFIDTLSALGAKIALDDFGAGYTSFGYLAEINADFVKIDGSLIRGLEVGSNRYEIVKGIVAIAHSLNIGVVAEWVEEVATITLLQDIGVDSLQGWALSKPRALEDIGEARNGLDFIESTEISRILLSKQNDLEFNI
jgi:EAL domain-containing protein (putative c-di-GMP-specific phosphodiesterase class I)/GGDEF domain-containing protein/PAS domain-containing protein